MSRVSHLETVPPAPRLGHSPFVVMSVRGSVTQAVKGFTKRRKCREYVFIFIFPREEKDWVQGGAPAPGGQGFEL